MCSRPRRPRDTENRPVVPSRHEPFVREPYPKDPYLDSYYRSHYPASPPIRYDPYYDLYERRHLPPLPRELYYREQLTDLYGRPIAADYFMRRSPPPVSSLYARLACFSLCRNEICFYCKFGLFLMTNS